MNPDPDSVSLLVFFVGLAVGLAAGGAGGFIWGTRYAAGQRRKSLQKPEAPTPPPSNYEGDGPT